MKSKSQRWHLCCSPNWQVWYSGCPFWLKKRIFFAFWRESVEKSPYPHEAFRDILKAVSLDWPEYGKMSHRYIDKDSSAYQWQEIFLLAGLLDGVNVKKEDYRVNECGTLLGNLDNFTESIPWSAGVSWEENQDGGVGKRRFIKKKCHQLY